MATGGCSPVAFVGTCANNFYFKVVTETEVEADCFTITDRLFNRFVRSEDNKFLLLHDDQFQVQDLSRDQLPHHECKFKIQTYKDIPGGRVGMAAMLFVRKEDKDNKEINMVACCRKLDDLDDDVLDDVYPEEMTLPSSIEESKHKAVFYMTKQTGSNTYTFESSVNPSYYLGFQTDGENPCLKKLVLCHKGKDEPDLNSEVVLSESF